MKLRTKMVRCATFAPVHILCMFCCSSMFAVWGSRTEGGALYSARNLDWNKDTGVNKHKVVMVVVPDDNDGGIPSVTLGFACLYGTLAGMSAKGIHYRLLFCLPSFPYKCKISMKRDIGMACFSCFS